MKLLIPDLEVGIANFRTAIKALEDGKKGLTDLINANTSKELAGEAAKQYQLYEELQRSYENHIRIIEKIIEFEKAKKKW